MKISQRIFEIGDKVYCCIFGWGIVEEINYHHEYPIKVKNTSMVASYTIDGRYWESLSITLSFTEYKLEGFTQERPEKLPNIGDIVWVRDTESQDWVITHFIKKMGSFYVCSDSSSETDYLTSWDYITTENPYKNEHRNEN
jgi:hypothetical protein